MKLISLTLAIMEMGEDNISTCYKFYYIIMPPKLTQEQIEPYLDPLKFYNHGDNPAMKNFIKIAMANVKDGKVIDHRSFVIDKGQRYAP